jgi:hypothetical protein
LAACGALKSNIELLDFNHTNSSNRRLAVGDAASSIDQIDVEEPIAVTVRSVTANERHMRARSSTSRHRRCSGGSRHGRRTTDGA